MCSGPSCYLFTAHDYPINGCTSCSHRWAEVGAAYGHVAEVYGDSYFSGGGAGYPDYLGDGALLVEKGRRYAEILDRYAERGSILDVGAAAGFILKGFSESGWIAQGIEPNAAMARFGRENLGLDIATSTLEDFDSPARFDVVALIQVLPHFVDPRRGLESAAGFLRENGLLLVEFWNCNTVTAKIFGSRWHEYSPPSVLHWFTRSGLQRFAGEYRFSEVASGRPAKKISGRHAKSLVKHKLGKSWRSQLLLRALAVVPDSMTLRYPGGDLEWMLFIKQPTLESLH